MDEKKKKKKKGEFKKERKPKIVQPTLPTKKK